MNAGLSCPDWPLCFGKVIPDFHPTVWFEFVHRAYAGLVAIVFFAIATFILLSKKIPVSAKRTAVVGLVALVLQIAAGALTVLWLVKWFAVTSHLILATIFFISVAWMHFSIFPNVQQTSATAPRLMVFSSGFFSLAVFAQIFMGGVVASTYAGLVCVDWPLCGGQWVPTWTGAIGHQIVHRFIAYGLALGTLVFFATLHFHARKKWMSRQLLILSRLAACLVFAQVAIGIGNLLLFIPPALTVLHQSVAMILLAIYCRIFFVTLLLTHPREYRAERSAPTFGTRRGHRNSHEYPPMSGSSPAEF